MSLILLAPDEPRCRPANGCAAKARCARALAAHTPGPVQDYSATEGGGGALCWGFLLPMEARRQAGEHFAAQARNRLAEAVERGKAQQRQRGQQEDNL